MDVKCEKCGTEYEFDDAKVSESGITVKCTHCGHLFRVARESIGVSPSSGAKRPTPPPRPNHWMIRNHEGEIREFKDLATLQQWIIERKVSRQDEISKTGESWKPLGSIIELSSFFIAVDGKGREVAAPPTTPLRRASVMTPSQAPAPPPPQGSADLLDTGEFRLEGPSGSRRREELSAEPTPARFPVTPGSATAQTPTSRHLETPPPEPALPQVSVQRTPPPTFSDRFTPAPYEPEPRVDGSTRGFVIGVVVTLLLAGGAYAFYQHLSKSPQPSAESLLMLERAERALEQDTDESRTQADGVYSELLARMGSKPADKDLATRIHVGSARVAISRAEYERLEGRDGRDALDRAERALANARSLSQEHPEVLLAYADYYRVMGVPDSARRYLRQARQGGANPAELAVVEAALGLHDKHADYAAVAERLGELPSEARDLPRAKYLHAVALERSGRRDQAIQVLVELLSKNRQHAAGSRLLQVLGVNVPAVAAAEVRDAGAVAPSGDLPTVKPEGLKADVGLALADNAAEQAAAEKAAAEKAAAENAAAEKAAAEKAAADKAAAEKADAEKAAAEKAAAEKAAAEKAAAAQAAAARVAKPAPEAAEGDAVGSYDVVMKSGYKLLESGKTQAAIRQFRRAIDMRPQSAEAWANLAWCELDLGHPDKAVRYFGRSLDINGRFADAMYGRAVAYERSNQKAQAVQAYERYLQVHGGSRKAETVRRRLERLR